MNPPPMPPIRPRSQSTPITMAIQSNMRISFVCLRMELLVRQESITAQRTALQEILSVLSNFNPDLVVLPRNFPLPDRTLVSGLPVTVGDRNGRATGRLVRDASIPAADPVGDQSAVLLRRLFPREVAGVEKEIISLLGRRSSRYSLFDHGTRSSWRPATIWVGVVMDGSKSCSTGFCSG